MTEQSIIILIFICLIVVCVLLTIGMVKTAKTYKEVEELRAKMEACLNAFGNSSTYEEAHAAQIKYSNLRDEIDKWKLNFPKVQILDLKYNMLVFGYSKGLVHQRHRRGEINPDSDLY